MSKNFKKKDIIRNLNKNTGYIIIKNIKIGNLTLKNLGTFKILDKKQRIGRNPKTKDPFIISARKTIKFTTSKKIQKRLNYE